MKTQRHFAYAFRFFETPNENKMNLNNLSLDMRFN